MTPKRKLTARSTPKPEPMGRAASTFKQTDFVRAVKAAQAAGLVVGAVEVSPDGTIRINVQGTQGGSGAVSDPFAAWKAKRDASANEGP